MLNLKKYLKSIIYNIAVVKVLYRKFPISGKDVNKKMTLHFHKQHITGISPNRMGGGTRCLISLKNTSRLYFQTLVSA